MTWTRLLYVKNLQQAFKRFIPGKDRKQLYISKRYQAEIRKQFRLAGVPWIYNIAQPKLNPRDKKPKAKKRDLARQIRLQKIQRALKEAPQKQLQYRQQRLNKRRLKGSDQLMSKGLPSWIKTDTKQIPHYMLRGRKGQ